MSVVGHRLSVNTPGVGLQNHCEHSLEYAFRRLKLIQDRYCKRPFLHRNFYASAVSVRFRPVLRRRFQMYGHSVREMLDGRSISSCHYARSVAQNPNEPHEAADELG